MELTAQVAEEIRVEGARQRMNGTALAHNAGLSKQTISRVTLGKIKRLDIEQIKAIATALGMPAWELVRRAEEDERSREGAA